MKMGTDTTPRPGTPRRYPVVVGSITVGAVLGALAVAVAGGWFDGAKPDPVSAVSAAAATPAASGGTSRAYTCRYTTRNGQLYAGQSSTTTTELGFGSVHVAVAEAQCLLKYHGISPGPVDASFGERTEAAVKRFQQSSNLVVDGLVGPHTWAVLRQPGVSASRAPEASRAPDATGTAKTTAGGDR